MECGKYISLTSNKSAWTNNNGQNGYWFSGMNTYSESVSRVFFPAAGYRDRDGHSGNRGATGDYWSSNTAGAHGIYIEFHESSSSVGTRILDTAYGYSVRCVKE